MAAGALTVRFASRRENMREARGEGRRLAESGEGVCNCKGHGAQERVQGIRL